MRLRVLAVPALLALLHSPASAGRNSHIDDWFPHLRAGMWVKVEGMLAENGALEATEVKILQGEPDEWEVSSNVRAVDVTRMTLETELGVQVVATTRTNLQGPKGSRRITFTFFESGDRVEVEGQLQKDGSMLAEEIEVKQSARLKPDLKHENEHEITAKIETIDAANYGISLLGVRVHFTPQTRNKTPFLD